MPPHATLRGPRSLPNSTGNILTTRHRSEIADKLSLEPEARARIAAARPAKSNGLCTIGYEGKSLENYLNQIAAGRV